MEQIAEGCLGNREGGHRTNMSNGFWKGMIVVLMALGLVACGHTVRGVGKDIEAGGRAIQRSTQ